MSRPRILFVLSGALDVGGAENQLLVTSRELVRRGFDVQILCLWKRGAMAGEAELNGVEVHSIPRILGEMRGPVAKLSRLLGGAVKVAARLKQWRPDVVHFILPHAYTVGGFVSLFFPDMSRVMSRRGMNRYLKRRPIARWQERFLHRRMQAVLANSTRVADELLDEGAPADRLGMIYNGIELDRFAGLPPQRDARRRFQLPQDALILIKVANLWEYKGHADLIEALAGADLGRDWLLLLVGRDEGAEDALLAQIRARDIDSRVRFMGATDQVPGLLAAADIGISVSHEEGFSNAVVEYLAAGLPVVATDVGGSREAVADAGLIVSAGDPGAIRQAITALADEDRRSDLVALARKRAASFDMKVCVDTYEALYRDLIQGKGVPPIVGYRPADAPLSAQPGADRNGMV